MGIAQKHGAELCRGQIIKIHVFFIIWSMWNRKELYQAREQGQQTTWDAKTIHKLNKKWEANTISATSCAHQTSSQIKKSEDLILSATKGNLELTHWMSFNSKFQHKLNSIKRWETKGKMTSGRQKTQWKWNIKRRKRKRRSQYKVLLQGKKLYYRKYFSPSFARFQEELNSTHQDKNDMVIV